MSDRAARIANLSPEQRRLLELMLQERDRERADEGIKALPRHSESGNPAVFPLTSAQRWLLSIEEEYLTPMAMRLRGPLDVSALEASLYEICVRHEALRTTFETRDGEPVQIVGPPRPVSLTQVDLRELPPPAREAEAGRLLAQEAQHSFDLSRDMMLHATLLRLDDEEHMLILVMHHIVTDGWSLDVLFRELWALYKALRSGGRASLPELPVQYADYVVWHRQRLQDGALGRSMEYWKKQLADAPKVLDIPPDHPPPPVRTWEGARQELLIPDSLVQELHALCRRQNATLFMTLLGAWATLLHRYSGQDDILVSTPFANRDRAEVEGLIGCFANILALRHDFSGDPSLAELLGRVRETAVDAFSHGEVPFQDLVEELDPRIWVSYTLLDTRYPVLKLDDLQVKRIEIVHDGCPQLFTLYMIEGDDGLTARLYYNTDLFEDATATRTLKHFQAVLESMVADPEQRLSELPLPVRPTRPAEKSVVADPERPVSKPPLPIDTGGGWRARFGTRLRRSARRARKRLRRVERRAQRWLLHVTRPVRKAAGRRLGGRFGRAGRRRG